MRLLGIFAVLWAGASAAQTPPDTSTVAKRAATKAYVTQFVGQSDTLVAIRKELDTLRGMIGMVGDTDQRVALLAQLAAVESRLNDVRAGAVRPPAHVKRPVERPKPASSAALSRLENSLRAANFREDKVRVVREAAKRHFFSTRQVETIITHFSFDDDRVDTIAALYPRLTDQENAHGLYGLLSSRTARETLEKRLNP